MTDEHVSEREAELVSKIKTLQAQLLVANRLSVDYAQAKNLEVSNLSPASLMDKHGAIAIVFAIFIQTAGAIWWASGLSQEVKTIEANATQRDTVIERISETLQINSERLTRVQTVQENVVKILDELSRREIRGPQQP